MTIAKVSLYCILKKLLANVKVLIGLLECLTLYFIWHKKSNPFIPYLILPLSDSKVVSELGLVDTEVHRVYQDLYEVSVTVLKIC